jgi:hypothetical protein
MSSFAFARPALISFVLSLVAIAACGDDPASTADQASVSSTTGSGASSAGGSASTSAGTTIGAGADAGAGQGGDGSSQGGAGLGGAGLGGAGLGGAGLGGDGGASSQGGAGQGGDAPGSGGGDASSGQGGAGALPACEAFRAIYLEMAEALECPNEEVAAPAYCDQFVGDPCLEERTAYWQCAERLFSEQACDCLEYQGQMLLRCGDVCSAESEALVECSLGS